ncbi:MAG: P-loop NTPase [Anaerolineaceae bacterium]|nr:P-loop NTPase [Anaerolineaceae bacterium]
MKQLIIISGKGGTGKTSFTGALSHLIAEDAQIHAPILVDADVDAANLELLLNPTIEETHLFSGGEIARINQEACAACGKCMEVCRFDAVLNADYQYTIDPISCEGCGACAIVCPTQAISLQQEINGEWYQSTSRYGTLVHASLYPGQENSGKLVERIRSHAERLARESHSDLILVDGPPGIGCAVHSAVTGADMAVLVTEPSVSGIHDMKRAYATLQQFSVPAVVCVNKYDLNLKETRKIEEFCKANQIPVIGMLPFDSNVITAMTQGQPVTAMYPDSTTSKSFEQIYSVIKSALLTPEVSE